VSRRKAKQIGSQLISPVSHLPSAPYQRRFRWRLTCGPTNGFLHALRNSSTQIDRDFWRPFLWAGVAVACVVFAVQRSESAQQEENKIAIHVRKSTREMWLQDGERITRHFTIALGKQPNGGKLHRGDGRTPEGRYYVCEKKTNSRFRKFLGLSYPNVDDAERGLNDKLITADEWADIFFANLRLSRPPWDTLLGGQVGIHGYGGRAELPIDWTEGCIAVSNDDIDYLYDNVPLGTAVVIND
jgi:murein L,D-transpeptidase YafK